MKQIIIFLLVIILGFVVYDFYKDWSRFHAPNYEYETTQQIDLNYHDQTIVYDYEEAIQGLNAYVKLQWTANDIDVRNPEDDDLDTQTAVLEYASKLAQVKYYENKLSQSHKYKKERLDDQSIQAIEKGLRTTQEIAAQNRQQLLLDLFNTEYEASRNIGSRSAFNYEVQKMLVNKGYEIPIDGVFARITSDAIADFEKNNGLFPDGKMDVLTFKVLIE